jgi:hypothetical protein
MGLRAQISFADNSARFKTHMATFVARICYELLRLATAQLPENLNG